MRWKLNQRSFCFVSVSMKIFYIALSLIVDGRLGTVALFLRGLQRKYVEFSVVPSLLWCLMMDK